MPQSTAYRQLVEFLSAPFDTDFQVEARDLADLSDEDLATVIRHERCVALDNFNAKTFADCLSSVVDPTDTDKALALWRALRGAAQEAAKELLASDINEHLEFYAGIDNGDAVNAAMSDAV